MTIAFACAVSHAPGITARPESAPPDQAARFFAGYETLRAQLAEARCEAVVAFTGEHWTNFFVDNYTGPIETAINIPPCTVPGDPALSAAVLSACFDAGVEPSFSEELILDHGTMIPLHFLTPAMDLPVVPIFVNALAPPFPSLRRCFALGEAVGRVLAASTKRIAVIATGGLSHKPGTPHIGTIDEDFDRRFLADFCSRDDARLFEHDTGDMGHSGVGTNEIRNWIALAGATPGWHGMVQAYEPIPAWSTGCALVRLSPPADDQVSGI